MAAAPAAAVVVVVVRGGKLALEHTPSDPRLKPGPVFVASGGVMTAICGSVRPAAALAIDSIGRGFDRAIEISV